MAHSMPTLKKLLPTPGKIHEEEKRSRESERCRKHPELSYEKRTPSHRNLVVSGNEVGVSLFPFSFSAGQTNISDGYKFNFPEVQ